MKINISNNWKQAENKINAGGTWKSAQAWSNIGGKWVPEISGGITGPLNNLGLSLSASSSSIFNGYNEGYWYWLIANSGSSSYIACKSSYTYTLGAGTSISLRLCHRTEDRTSSHVNSNGKQARIYLSTSSSYKTTNSGADKVLFLNPTTAGKPWSHKYTANITLDYDITNAYIWVCIDNNKNGDKTNIALESLSINGVEINKP